ncbi:uncharacterized protein LOC117296155 [Asterias rubens]|uniref:uncharacterized protein LOC117296155 n=1 Tax=Asterias rubens TaxID=7604 RepID=UPI0014550D00|nr:uncharacterized protein LOC117296155 [Asterias rubens]
MIKGADLCLFFSPHYVWIPKQNRERVFCFNLAKMSGYLLTLVCLVLSALILTMGPHPADTTLLTGGRGGASQESVMGFKRAIKQRTTRDLCATIRNEYLGCATNGCRDAKDTAYATHCGARKRTFNVDSSQFYLRPRNYRGPRH